MSDDRSESNYVEYQGKRFEKEHFFERKVLTKLVKESEKYPLLSREEEQLALSQYQEPRDKLYKLAQETYGLEKYPMPASWNSPPEVAIKKAILTSSSIHFSKEAKAALDKLILHNLRLLKRFAKTRKTGDLGPMDIFAYGLWGLTHSIDKFDRSRRNRAGEPLKLSTYSSTWIMQYCQRAYVDMGRTIRIPIHIHDQINKLGKIYARLSSEHFDSPNPTPEQLSAASGIPVDQVKVLGLYQADFSITSLDRETFADDEDSTTLLDSMGSGEPLPEDIAEKEANKAYIQELFGLLAPEDGKFMALMTGCLDGSERTVREMASAMALPRKDVQDRYDRCFAIMQAGAQREKVCLE